MTSRTAAASARQIPRFIAVEGPIGAGKTTLARRLAASFGHELVLELADENPFLESFYRERARNALATQLFFLIQRVRQVDAIRQADLFQSSRVTDFLIEKDRLFARLTLDDEEFALYEQVYERLAIDAPTPDLIVYLQAPADVLLERIARRGIEYEQQIERRYLERLTEGYARFFLEYDAAPVLIVNAAEIDPIGNEADYQALLAEIVRPRKGRHYFNPLKNLL